jgi:hypothetical protein
VPLLHVCGSSAALICAARARTGIRPLEDTWSHAPGSDDWWISGATPRSRAIAVEIAAAELLGITRLVSRIVGVRSDRQMEAPMVLHTGSDLFDVNGDKVGTVSDVVFDPMTLVPEWYEIKMGLFGGRHLVPAGSVTMEKDRGSVPFDKKVVKSAPSSSLPLMDEEKRTLLDHYKTAA